MVLLSWNHISHFHIFFFLYSPYATGKLHSNSLLAPSLGQFHYCFMSQCTMDATHYSPFPWSTVLMLRCKYKADTRCMLAFILRVTQRMGNSLCDSKSKSERIGYAFNFKISFILVHKHRGCVKDIAYIIWQVQIWMFDQRIRFHWNKTKQKIQIWKINS